MSYSIVASGVAACKTPYFGTLLVAAIAIPKFANTKEKAYLASMKSDLRNLITAEEEYFADSVEVPLA